MIQATGKVLRNEEITPSYFKLSLSLPRAFQDAVPGQFVMVRVPGDDDVILRRPFSIHNLVVENGKFKGIEILYKVVGKGTSRLSKAGLKEEVDTLGPLGKGFVLPKQMNGCFFVAGGIGIAPLVFLMADMKKNGHDVSRMTLFLGAASKNDLLCVEEAKKMGIHVVITTDDGSFGEKNLITVPLEKALHRKPPEIIFSCGPLIMLKEVAALAQRYHTPCQISLESMMACGMGACLGCAVNNAYHPDRYDHVCIDGPVFDMRTFRF